MPTTIKLKNSVTTTNAPSSLAQGEVAINVTDKKVWVGNAATTPVQLLGTGADGSFTNLSYTGTLTGGTGVINLGSGQFYKDASGNVSIGTTSSYSKLNVLGDAVIASSAGTANQIYFYSNGATSTTGSFSVGQGFASSTDSVGFIYNRANAAVVIGTNSAERMRVTSDGKVGIGTSAPPNPLTAWTGGTLPSEVANAQLLVGNTSGFANAGIALVANTSNDSSITFGSTASPTLGRIAYSNTNNAFLFYTNGANERMRIASTGGIRIGSSANPSASSAILSLVGAPSGGASCTQQFTYNGGTYGGSLIGSGSQGGGMEFYTFTGNVGSESYTERMRIDSSGRLLISTTATTPGYFNTSTGTQIQGGAIFTSSTGGSAFANPTSGGGVLMSFGTGNFWNTGTISTNNSNTSYNTSSDYRLKENIAPMAGALAKVAALKPCTYTWKADGSDGEGFIAHELQEICPNAVTGEKDAVDSEGKPVYQGIDTSFLVATLTAAIQEQQVLINQLTTRLNALEGK